ncbi:MAG: hypothetical protein QM473_15900 [Acidobacteriota bacterium]|nr:hypothetical protein [Acidobacteriota bacterium]
MSGPGAGKRGEFVAYAVLTVLAVGFLWRCNFGGKVMLPGDLLLIMEPWKHYSRQFPEFRQVSNPILDAVQQFYPWRKFAGESLRAGQVPFWNPYELCGNPFVGNNQSAVFYPETWLSAIMPAERALGWATSLYFLISGALMYAFLRAIALRRAACLFGAVAFMFNGFVIGWLCFPSFRSVPGWLPGMLLGVEVMARGRRGLGAAICAACTGLQFLAGNLHISLYVLMIFAAYAVFRLVAVWREEGRLSAVSVAWWIACGVGIGGALACAQLLPTLELAGLSSRAEGAPYLRILENALAPQALLAGLMPDLFGNPVDYNHWGAELGKVYRAYTESTFYVGVLPVLFAPLAFTHNRREPLFWLAVAAVGALLATGTHLNAVLYYLVPSFSSLSGIGRAVVMICVGVSVLGAYGVHALLEMARKEPDQIARRVTACALGLGLFGLISGLWVWMATAQFERALPGIGDYTLAQIGRFALFVVLGAVGAVIMRADHRVGASIIILCLAADLYLYVDKFTPATNPAYLRVEARAVATMQAEPGPSRMLSLGKDPIRRMSPNTPMLFGLEDIQGSDSLEIGAYRRVWSEYCTDEHGFPQPVPSLPVIDLLGVRLVHSSFPLEGVAGLELVSDFDGYLYRNTEAYDRAFSLAKIPQSPGSAQEVGSKSFRPGKRGRGEVSEVRHETNMVTVRGQFVPGEAVVLADTYFPGWRAFADGRPVPVRRVFHALRATAVDEPVQEIRYAYVPGSGWVGGFLTLMALGMIAGLVVAERTRARVGGASREAAPVTGVRDVQRTGSVTAAGLRGAPISGRRDHPTAGSSEAGPSHGREAARDQRGRRE